MLASLLPTIGIILLAVLLFAAALIIYRAMMYGRLPDEVEPSEIAAAESALVAEHLAEAIQVQTISVDGEPPAGRVFEEMHRTLERMYPRVHAALTRERINEYSLLYTWRGRAEELEPVLFCAHMDVVPADPVTRAEWTHPPFSGEIADGQVWGRGALDMKSTLITLMEAVEGLIRAGYQPERTLYLGFGHDEEVSGQGGARQISAALAERGVKLAAVLDEGAGVMTGMLPGMTLPAALIGVTEKGYASVELRVEGRPGHSSMPPKHTAIGVLARAIARVEESPMPVRMSMAKLMFEELGVFLPFSLRMAFANPLIFGAAVRKRFLASAQTAALVRTTMAVTLINGGIKDNILPAQARAVVNCRLMPGDTREAVVEHIRRAVNDEAVQVSLAEEHGWDASPVSPVDSPVYRSLSQAIRQLFPDAAVAPYLMAGATDSRYYTPLCENVYRFSPIHYDEALLKTVHGIDERIPVEHLGSMVAFYAGLMKTWTKVVGG